MYHCEQCGKEVYEPFGSGRFCSRSCSNKWVALHQSDDAKARKIEAGKKNLRPPKIGSNLSESTRLKISISLKRYYKENNILPFGDRRGSTLSKEARKKISDSARYNAKHGLNGWKSGDNRIPNTYERFTRSYLSEKGILYDAEVPISQSSLGNPNGSYYRLDFLINGVIDLEIDGSSHSVEYDRLRDNYLSNAGYIVYRISHQDDLNILRDELDKSVSMMRLRS